MTRSLFLPALLLALPAAAAEHPSAEISNGPIAAKIYLPDPVKGYYRGTRFDWSGAIYSLTYQGHQYFGEWQKSDDPYLHDRITGPVEEYRSGDSGPGYAEAGPGGRFLRIGVGVCERPQESNYQWRNSYKVVDPGKWTIGRGGNWIEFTQEVTEPKSGYGYRYTKRLTLTPGKPELFIDHVLQNTGKKAFASNVYNHNFFVIDGQATGPDFSVRFPFDLKADRDLKGYAAVRGKELVYLKEIPAGDNIITLFSGYGATAEDHRFAIENKRTKAGVRMATDRPLSKLQFWSPNTTLCPEPFIDLNVEPGQAERWSIRYEFYVLQ
jgi:hypothetical protein